MAKHHKFMWEGVDLVTSLSAEQVVAIVRQQERASDRVEPVSESPQSVRLAFTTLPGKVKFNAWGKTNPWLTFEIQISDEASGRRQVRTVIRQALTSGDWVKKMDGEKHYMKWVRALEATIKTADPTAVATYREGPMPKGFSLESLWAQAKAPTA